MSDQSVAKEILRQLGGGKFIAITGAKNFVSEGTALWFKLPGTPGFVKQGINAVEIRLMPSDTYTVRFWRVIKGEATKKGEVEGVYFDQLQNVFEEHTGLVASL